MAKPKAIQWLEEETGQTIDYLPEVNVGQDRHLSVRLTGELATGLDAMAAERGLTVSHLVRALLADAVGRRSIERDTNRVPATNDGTRPETASCSIAGIWVVSPRLYAADTPAGPEPGPATSSRHPTVAATASRYGFDSLSSTGPCESVSLRPLRSVATSRPRPRAAIRRVGQAKRSAAPACVPHARELPGPSSSEEIETEFSGLDLAVPIWIKPNRLLGRKGGGSCKVPFPAAHLLSNHYNLTRDRYYRELDKASKSGGDIDGFVAYAIEGFVDGIRSQIAAVREQQLSVAWVNFVHNVMAQFASGKACDRQTDLVLAMPTDRRISRSELAGLNAELAVQYAQTGPRTLARDLNRLEGAQLIRKVGRSDYRARIDQMSAFLPAIAPQANGDI